MYQKGTPSSKQNKQPLAKKNISIKIKKKKKKETREMVSASSKV
jgi:hypothetical protein